MSIQGGYNLAVRDRAGSCRVSMNKRLRACSMDGFLRVSKRLTELKRGQTAVVAGVNGAHYSSKHLADIGFVRGARIEMLRPGSPCIVKIHGGACVALGTGYQVSISVEPLAASIAPSSGAEAGT